MLMVIAGSIKTAMEDRLFRFGRLYRKAMPNKLHSQTDIFIENEGDTVKSVWGAADLFDIWSFWGCCYSDLRLASVLWVNRDHSNMN